MPEAEKQPEGVVDEASPEGGSQGDGTEKKTTSDSGTEEHGTGEQIKPTDDAENLDLPGLTKTEDGFEYKVGTSVYKGATLNEVLKNAGKGIADKDEYIGRTRTKKATDAAEKAVVDFGQPKAKTTDFPSEQEIQRDELAKQLQRYPTIDPKMLSWTDAQWDAFEAEHEIKPWKMVELRQDVRTILKDARASAESRIDQVSVEALNREIVSDELDSVKELIVESGIDPDDFDFNKVLTEAAKTQSSKGVFKSGSIVREATKEVNRILKDTQKSPIAKKLAEDIARGKEAKEKIPSPGGTGAQQRERGPKVAADYEEATRNAIKDIERELARR